MRIGKKTYEKWRIISVVNDRAVNLQSMACVPRKNESWERDVICKVPNLKVGSNKYFEIISNNKHWET